MHVFTRRNVQQLSHYTEFQRLVLDAKRQIIYGNKTPAGKKTQNKKKGGKVSKHISVASLKTMQGTTDIRNGASHDVFQTLPPGNTPSHRQIQGLPFLARVYDASKKKLNPIAMEPKYSSVGTSTP